MNFIDITFLIYTFIGLYMLSLFILIYIPNRKKLFFYPKSKIEPVSIIIPCYNESATIDKTIESILELDYPKNMIEIIVVDDCSTDNSAEIVRGYVNKHRNIKLIVNKKNSGGAAEPTNIGVKAAKYKYVAVTDADSSPQPDVLKKMIGFLQEDEKVGSVTCCVLAKKPKTFIQHLQSIEYLVIAFGRKLLDCVDAVYVTPGPFALYRKEILLKVGLFDTENLTQDIEIVWRLLANDYKARMCLSAKVYSETPKKFKHWWKQRIRWNIGGLQTIRKYKTFLFKKQMLGAYIIPYFTASLFIGLFGLGLFAYLLFRRLTVYYLSTSYSIYAHSTLLTLQDLTFAPSILNFFGVSLFLLGSAFTLIVISIMKEPEVQHKNVFNILFYLIIYLAVYPLIMLRALTKYATKRYSW